MNNKLSNVFDITKKFLNKHSPEILTGIGIAGLLSSTVLAVKATPKALLLIDDEINRKNDENIRLAEEKGEDTCEYITKLKPVDLIKTCWREYLPSVGIAIAGTACIVGASAINYKRNAALATVYAISERTLSTYRDKVIETIGEKKEKEIREQIAQDNINKDKDKPVIITSKGNTLIKDTISGRYFRSDIDTIKKVINTINRRLTYDHYISLNELYNELGLENVKNGSLIGWNLDNGLIEPSFETCLAENDEPCVVLDYYVGPKHDFDKLI